MCCFLFRTQSTAQKRKKYFVTAPKQQNNSEQQTKRQKHEKKQRAAHTLTTHTHSHTHIQRTAPPILDDTTINTHSFCVCTVVCPTVPFWFSSLSFVRERIGFFLVQGERNANINTSAETHTTLNHHTSHTARNAGAIIVTQRNQSVQLFFRGRVVTAPVTTGFFCWHAILKWKQHQHISQTDNATTHNSTHISNDQVAHTW